jgi:hypothetical protein
MKINIQLRGAVSVFVPFLVKDTGSLSVCFTHKIVFTLTPQAKSLGCAGITTIPSLSGTVHSQRCKVYSYYSKHTFAGTCYVDCRA